jgi:hypothetical protein
MTRVWLAQCLCAQRHAIMAAAGEADGKEEAEDKVVKELNKTMERWIDEGAMDPRCGLCGAPRSTWHFELGLTVWGTLAEAKPVLRQHEAEQIAIGALYGELGRGDAAGGRMNERRLPVDLERLLDERLQALPDPAAVRAWLDEAIPAARALIAAVRDGGPMARAVLAAAMAERAGPSSFAETVAGTSELLWRMEAIKERLDTLKPQDDPAPAGPTG